MDKKIDEMMPKKRVVPNRYLFEQADNFFGWNGGKKLFYLKLF